MFGFDNYLPSQWLDGVLAVHVTPLRQVVQRVSRSGKWVAKGAVAASIAAGGITHAGILPLPAHTETVSHWLAPSGTLMQKQSSDAMPEGYFAALKEQVSTATRLPDVAMTENVEYFF